MSLITSTANTSAVLPAISLHGHGHHKKGGSSASGDTTAQTPSSTQGLLSRLLQSLEQVTGVPVSALTGAPAASATSGAVSGTAATASAASAAPAPGSAAAAAPAVSSADAAERLQNFMHTLFQALKADGLGGAGGTTTTTAAVTPTGSAAGAAAPDTGLGQYSGSLASSLQTLIQQVGSAGATTGTAAANLSASFNNLIAGVGGTTAAAAGTGGTAASTASLQSFLSGLLQDVRNGGGDAFRSLGATVNANV